MIGPGSLLPVQDSVLHAGEEADFPSGCSRAAADEQRRSDARRTAGLERERRVQTLVLHSGSVGTDNNRPVLGLLLGQLNVWLQYDGDTAEAVSGSP